MDKPKPPYDTTVLWGLRPVRWALQMLGENAQIMVSSLSPAEMHQAAEFLGLVIPTCGRLDEIIAQFVAAAQKRRETIATNSEQDDSLLRTNLHLLQKALALSELDADIIMFRAMLRLHPGFEALAGKYIGLCCDFVFHRRLAVLFNAHVTDVTDALSGQGRLVENGLVSVRAGILGPLESRLRLMTNLTSSLLKAAASADELLATVLPRKHQASLRLSDYPHLACEISLLRDHFGAANTDRRIGVNTLLHGTPGTGKTELAGALAASFGIPLYVCSGTMDSHTSLQPRDRLREVVELQRLVRVAGGGLILVDEAEDIFPTVWSDSEKTPTKAAVNECLERNPTPTIWISNRIRHIDEAFLRRFDLVLHVPPLPSSAKRELLRKSLPPQAVSEREIRGYANQRKLSPAMLTRLARVACAANAESAMDISRNLRLISNNYLRTLGESASPIACGMPQLEHDLSLLNTDPPLDSIIEMMSRASLGARMLLHGPPGTGKTALGKALAERLDKPLLRRLAASLLSMFVGGTEHNLRDMFEEARLENGVLLLDEADSFLSDRSQAFRRWEITETNELLTQMEAFDGIFICTTNRLADLDPAALRRFDLKVEFKSLRLEQQLVLLRQCCECLGIPQPCDDDRALLGKLLPLESLTPGDAAAALRRLHVSGEATTIAMLLDALRDECRYKPHASQPIGFVH